MDDLDSIRIRALRAVWKPDYEATLRRIFRWYSEKFYTPLHLVPDLPIEDVLATWFEVNYESMEPDERHNLAIHLLETPDERRQREVDNRRSEDEFIQLTQAMAARQRTDKKLQERVAEVKSTLDKLKTSMPKQLKETELPTSRPEPKEEISISFTEEKFDMDQDGFPSPLKRK